MEGEMKNRLALLGILLVTGLLMAGIGTAIGAGSLLKFAGKQVRAVAMNDQLKIYEDNKLVKEITLPEGEYVWESSGYKIVLHKMTAEEMKKHQAEAEAEKNEFLEIAKKDGRVRELIDGKAYEVVSVSTIGTVKGETKTAILMLEVEGKYYEVTIDLNSKTVKSVEEKSSAVIENCYGPNGPVDCSKLPLHGPYMSR